MPLPTLSLYPAKLSEHVQARYPTNATVSVLVRSDGADDGYGNPTPVYTSSGSYPVWIRQRDEPVEVTNGADLSVSDYRMVEPTGTMTVTHRDRVDDGTRVFEVVGTPDHAAWPGGATHRVDVNLRLVT